MLHPDQIAAQLRAEGDARYLAAVADYDDARRTIEQKRAAGRVSWMDLDRVVVAERLVRVFIDERQYRAMNDRLIAEVRAEQLQRRGAA